MRVPELSYASMTQKGTELLSIIAEDPELQVFDRVVIHGEHPYYIDYIKVVKV
jgi:hypothetical protein